MCRMITVYSRCLENILKYCIGSCLALFIYDQIMDMGFWSTAFKFPEIAAHIFLQTNANINFTPSCYASEKAISVMHT